MHSATTSLRAPVGARAGAATNLTARARWGGDGEPAAPRGEREPAAPRARVPHHRRRANTRAAAGGDGELAKRVKAATVRGVSDSSFSISRFPRTRSRASGALFCRRGSPRTGREAARTTLPRARRVRR
jgi:hypothetical protein